MVLQTAARPAHAPVHYMSNSRRAPVALRWPWRLEAGAAAPFLGWIGGASCWPGVVLPCIVSGPSVCRADATGFYHTIDSVDISAATRP
jgi:hypothetical protein